MCFISSAHYVLFNDSDISEQDEREQLIQAYKKILAQVPNYEEALSALSADMLQVLLNIVSLMPSR